MGVVRLLAFFKFTNNNYDHFPAKRKYSFSYILNYLEITLTFTMTQLPKAQLDQLKAFVTLLKINPAVLDDPDLEFFRDYLLSVGAKLPTNAKESKDEQVPKPDTKLPTNAKENKDEQVPMSETTPSNEPEAMEQDEPE